MPPKPKKKTVATAQAEGGAEASAASNNTSGVKRKRTNEEKLKDIKAAWEKAKEKKSTTESQASDDEHPTPAKKQKVSPKKGGRKKSTESDLPLEATTAAAALTRGRRKDAPQVAYTPPRTMASASKMKPEFCSPKPIISVTKVPKKEEDDADDGNIVPAPPTTAGLPDIPLGDDDGKTGGSTLRPVAAAKKSNPSPEEERQGMNEATQPMDGDSDEFDDDDYDDESHSSIEDEDMGPRGIIPDELARLDRQGEGAPAPVPQKKTLFSRIIRVVITLAFTGWATLFFLPTSLRDKIPPLWTPSPPRTVCFEDSPHQKPEETVGTVAACADTEGTTVWQNCPSDSYCRGGKLLKCPDGFTVMPYGCILTATSNETIDAILGLLKEWTATDTCKGHRERYEEYGFGHRPLFHYSRVTGELEMGYNLGLIKNANHSRFLLKSTKSGDVWIGLHPKVHVRLTYLCYYKQFVYGLIGLFMFCISFICKWVWFIACQYWGGLMAEPLLVSGSTVFGFVVLTMYLRKVKEDNARRLLANDMFACREIATEFLSSRPDISLETNKILEEIQWKRYPMSKKDRKRVEKVVMPKLVEEFRSDTRIRNIRQLNNGKPMDAWQWVAPQVRKEGRNVQFAHTGTKTEAKGHDG